MQWVPGIPGELAFEHLARNAVDLNGHRIRVCSPEDLTTMKRAAGRPRDLLISRSFVGDRSPVAPAGGRDDRARPFQTRRAF
jgi:hypothetical protein